MDLSRKFGISKKYIKSFYMYVVSFFATDERYVKNKFKSTFGYDLELDNPISLNEKMQFIKLRKRRDEYIVFADKLLVREYVSRAIGDKYLIPIFSILKSQKELNIDMLPNIPFIIKTNHDSSGGIIARHKSELDLDYVKALYKFNLWNNHYYISREIHYKNLERRILIEKLLLDKNGKIPNDYKVNCINGKAEFVYCAVDREGQNYRKIYDLNWKPVDFKWGDKKDFDKKFTGPDITIPQNFSEMIEISEKLAKGFPYLRIDLYNVDGDIFVGEITIFHGGGFDLIEPRSVDIALGEKVQFD
ncbi:ATP-grasp fold amidoligase family protein [Shewanella sp. 125m-1]